MWGRERRRRAAERQAATLEAGGACDPPLSNSRVKPALGVIVIETLESLSRSRVAVLVAGYRWSGIL